MQNSDCDDFQPCHLPYITICISKDLDVMISKYDDLLMDFVTKFNKMNWQ